MVAVGDAHDVLRQRREQLEALVEDVPGAEQDVAREGDVPLPLRGGGAEAVGEGLEGLLVHDAPLHLPRLGEATHLPREAVELGAGGDDAQGAAALPRLGGAEETHEQVVGVRREGHLGRVVDAEGPGDVRLCRGPDLAEDPTPLLVRELRRVEPGPLVGDAGDVRPEVMAVGREVQAAGLRGECVAEEVGAVEDHRGRSVAGRRGARPWPDPRVWRDVREPSSSRRTTTGTLECRRDEQSGVDLPGR